MDATGFHARFELRDDRGKGGMGVVRRYFDRELKRLVAIKSLPPEFVTRHGRQARLEREALALAALDHPNIVAVYALVTLPPPDGPQIVMQYVDGDDLDQRLRSGPIPITETAGIAAQIAFALEAAHAKGFVHRDLKPGNVMLTQAGLVKVVDFGLAVRPPDSKASTLTGSAISAPGQVLGTPGYMSPEQCRGGAIDARADLWALGCLLYECLTGFPAFAGDCAADRISATLTRDPELSRLPAATPMVIRHLLTRCLQKPVDLRDITAGDARNILESVAGASRSPTPLTAEGGVTPPNNLPRETTSFVGRSAELLQLRELLASKRLVTVTGLSGIGKTRLVRRLAQESSGLCDRVVLVDLSCITDPAHVAPEFARALEVPEQSGRERIAAIAATIGPRRVLLVIDHCESTLDACADLVSRILASCPDARVLIASARALGTPGEQRITLGPLPCPVPGDTFRDIAACDSVQLLVDRARLAFPRFLLTSENAASLSGICRRYDGVPIAIELAARRMRSITPSDLLARLQRESAPPRDALSGAFDATYHLLPEPERSALRQIAVFRGGWTLDAAEHLLGDQADALTLLDALVDTSLVSISLDGAHTRYWLLESIRLLALAQLRNSPDQELTARDRHLDHFLAAAESLQVGVLAGDPASVAAVAADLENIRAALRHAAQDRVDPRLGLRLATAIYRFWYLIGQFAEGRRSLEAALHRRGDACDAPQAAGLNALGILALGARDHADAQARFEQSLHISRTLGDKPQVAGRLSNLGIIAEQRGQLDQARTLHEQALARYLEIPDPFGAAKARLNLGVIAQLQGAPEEARALYEQCLTDFDRLGEVHRGAIARHNLGELHWASGEYEQAARLFARSRTMRWDMADWPGVVYTLRWEAFVAEKRDRPTLSALAIGVADAIEKRKDCRSYGDPPEAIDVLRSRLDTVLSEPPLSQLSQQGTEPSNWQGILRELDADIERLPAPV